MWVVDIPYRGQYDILIQELRGIPAEALTQEVYSNLQEQICHNALENAYKKSQWKPGEEAPSSGKKRLNLLYLLIDDLKTVEGYNIPARPHPMGAKFLIKICCWFILTMPVVFQRKNYRNCVTIKIWGSKLEFWQIQVCALVNMVACCFAQWRV